MPKRNDIQRILIIGSGPSTIGCNGEYDAAATQSVRTLKEMGYEVVVLNSDMTSMMTDMDMADRIYIDPPTAETVMEIAKTEKPDALLPLFGGKAAFQAVHQLNESGFLEVNRIQVLGAGKAAMDLSEDKFAFKAKMSQMGFNVIEGRSADSADAAMEEAGKTGFPLVVRPGLSFSGVGIRLVYNLEELQTAVEDAFSESLNHRVLMETAVMGWQELEMVGLRDRDNQCAIVGRIENVDPMGIHSGDSVCALPFLTVPETARQNMERMTVKIMEALNVIGLTHVRFALPPLSEEPVAVEANCRFNRSSMLAARVHGLQLAAAATRLACGETLAEIEKSGSRLSPRDLSLPKTIAVKFPKWSFQNYPGISDRLDTRMRAIGEAIGFGATYAEAFSAAIQTLEGESPKSGASAPSPLSPDELLNALGTPTSRRQHQLCEAVRNGSDLETISHVTGIRPWFIRQLNEATVNQEEPNIPDAGIHWAPVAESRKTVPVFYPTTAPTDKMKAAATKTTNVMIVGNGPHEVGRGTEFDHSCIQAATALEDKKCARIILTADPTSKSLDPQMSDACYFSALTPRNALSACRHAAVDKAILQFGGSEALRIGAALEAAGIHIPGTAVRTMQMVETPAVFRQRMRELGIPQPDFGIANDVDAARTLAAKFGFPLIVRPLGQEGPQRNLIVHNESSLKAHFQATAGRPAPVGLLVEQFLEYAIEVSADALLDGDEAYIPAVSENIELAGVHEGDSACVIPPYSTPLRHVETIEEYIRKIGKELGLKGLFNARFAVYKDTVYLLEASCRASRTLPFVSKVCRVPMAKLAVRILLGDKIPEMGLSPVRMPYFCVKESVFPFDLFPEVDPLLGPVMQSTGVVQGMADSFGMAYYKSQKSALLNTPAEGAVLITVTDEDKPSILEPARRFREMGFTIKATKGTCDFLSKNGIPAAPVRKLGFGRPHLVDEIKTGQIHMVINTPSGKESQEDDAHIRKAAIRCGIPNVTTPAGALAAAKGIEARRRSKDEIRSLNAYYGKLI